MPAKSTITPENIERMRSLAEDGASRRAIGQEFGISHTAVSKYIRTPDWKIPVLPGVTPGLLDLDVYTPMELAARLVCTPRRINTLCEQGLLPFADLGARAGGRRIPKEGVRRFLGLGDGGDHAPTLSGEN